MSYIGKGIESVTFNTATTFDVTGNITVGGTVDGRDVATDGTKLDTITSGAIADILQDTTPQLGGNLDLNTSNIIGTGNINVTGSITGTSFVSTGNMSFTNNSKAIFGTSPSLEIYHDGSNSILDDVGAGNFKMQLAGADKLEITSTGVSVTGTVAATAFSGDGSALTGIPTPTLTSLGIANHDDITVDGSGNVGIGTANPQNKVHIVAGSSGSTSFDSRYNLTIEDDGENYIGIYAPNNSYSGVRFVNADNSIRGNIDYYHGTNGDKMVFYAQNEYQFSYPGTGVQHVFKQNGNVGIGTSSPSDTLEVSNASNYQLRLTSSGQNYQIGRNGSDGLLHFYGNQSGYTGYVFSGVNGEHMRIDSNGNVGIGGAPSYPLHVQGNQLYLTNAGNTELMTTNTNGGVTGGIQALSNQSVRVGSISNYNCEMVVNNVVKGTWSPTGLDISGNVSATGYVTGGAGSIVQQQTRSTVTYMTINPVNNWTEVHSNFRISITPKFSNSIIVVQYAIPFNPTGAANILFGFKPFRLIGSTYYDFSTTGGALNNRNLLQSAFARSNNGYDVNDQNQYTLLGVDAPNTTSTCTYGFYYSSEGSNNTLFCHSNGNNSNWGWTAPVHIIATEIRQ